MRAKLTRGFRTKDSEVGVVLRQDYVDEHVPEIYIAAHGARLANMTFTRCEFDGIMSYPVDCCPPAERVTIANIATQQCRGNVAAHGAVINGVSIDGWKGPGRFGPQLFNCAFRRTRLAGLIKWLTIGTVAYLPGPEAEFWQAYIDDNHARYRETDWALDVSEAVLSNCQIQGIPPELIRCNRQTQAVISGQSMQGAADVFEGVDLVGTIGMTIQFYLDESSLRSDGLIWIEGTSKVRAQELELVAMLHENGLALPVLERQFSDVAHADELAPIIVPRVLVGDPTTALRLVVVREADENVERPQPPGLDVVGESISVDRAKGSVDGMRFEGKRFDYFSIGPGWDASPDQRLVIRGAQFQRCSFAKASITKTLIDEVRFETIGCPYPTTIGGLALQECALRHVVLAGDVQHLTVRSLGPTEDLLIPEQRLWAEANDELHAKADWVLDVSDAELIACRISGLPADKIRYDLERQAVVTPESLTGAADVFADVDLVGVVGFTIRQALLKRYAQIRHEPLLWADPRRETRDHELELIRMLHDNDLVVPSR